MLERKPFIHALAVVESANIGEGTRIWAYAHVFKGAEIGSNCNLGEGVFVEGSVKIGKGCTIKNGVAFWEGIELEEGVFVGPVAAFTNVLKPRSFIKTPVSDFSKTLIRRGATIGANATIVCGIEIGAFAFIGAGAVVTKDIPAHSLVLGNPGKIVGRVCYCGERLKDGDFCPACKKELKEIPVPL